MRRSLLPFLLPVAALLLLCQAAGAFTFDPGVLVCEPGPGLWCR